LDSVFEKLKNSAGIKGDGPVRLFFPNGIELISVALNVNAKDGIRVEVKIAGEKGVKGAGAFEDLAAPGIASGAPTISFLDPNEVPLNWEGPVKIFGTGFDADSFAMFDGKVPRTLLATETLLKVSLTQEITGKPGEKTVVVHTGAGSLSNEVKFL